MEKTRKKCKIECKKPRKTGRTEKNMKKADCKKNNVNAKTRLCRG